MMMDSEVDYSKLTDKELKILIAANDRCALEEFNKRVKEGKVQLTKYTRDEAGDIVAKNLKAELNTDTDYKKLTDRELRILMRIDDPKAEDEHHRRVIAGEIKTRRVTFEDIAKMYGIDKSA